MKVLVALHAVIVLMDIGEIQASLVMVSMIACMDQLTHYCFHSYRHFHILRNVVLQLVKDSLDS